MIEVYFDDIEVEFDSNIEVDLIGAQLIVDNSLENSYCYPKLTQETSYRTGDEGWQIANVFNSIYGGFTTRRAVIGLADFYTLEVNNQFGNTSRFTLSDGTAVTDSTEFLAGQAIYDNYLGLQFKRVTGLENVSWNAAIDGVRAFDDGSWYPLPLVIFDLLSNFNGNITPNDVIITSNNNWTATTNPVNTSQAFFYAQPRNLFVAKTTTTLSAEIAYKLI